MSFRNISMWRTRLITFTILSSSGPTLQTGFSFFHKLATVEDFQLYKMWAASQKLHTWSLIFNYGKFWRRSKIVYTIEKSLLTGNS